MTEQTEASTLTLDQKIDALANGVYENNRMIQLMLEALNNYLSSQRAPVGPSYPTGYPNHTQQAAPPNEFDNRFTEQSEYRGAEEDQRAGRTFTQMENLVPTGPPDTQPPPHHPTPPPPGGMPPPPEQYADGGERVMTPDEYREAHPE